MRLRLALLPFFWGCATIGTMQTAETVGRGRVELGIEPGAWGVYGDGRAMAAPDLGVSDPAADGVVVSVAPSAGLFLFPTGGGAFGQGTVQVPVLVGIGVGPHQVVLGPKVHLVSAFAAAEELTIVQQTFGVGSSLGFAVALGERVTLLPEIAVVKPLLGGGGSEPWGGLAEGNDVAYTQYAFAVLIDFGK